MLICYWKRYFLDACQLILVILIMHKIMLHMNKKGDGYHSRFCMASSAVFNLPVDLNLTLNFSYQITSKIDVYHLLEKNRNFLLAKFCKMFATEFIQRNVLLKPNLQLFHMKIYSLQITDIQSQNGTLKRWTNLIIFVCLFVCLVCLLFCVLLENSSLLWRRDHCRRRAAKRYSYARHLWSLRKNQAQERVLGVSLKGLS